MRRQSTKYWSSLQGFFSDRRSWSLNSTSLDLARTQRSDPPRSRGTGGAGSGPPEVSQGRTVDRASIRTLLMAGSSGSAVHGLIQSLLSVQSHAGHEKVKGGGTLHSCSRTLFPVKDPAGCKRRFAVVPNISVTFPCKRRFAVIPNSSISSFRSGLVFYAASTFDFGVLLLRSGS